MPPMMSGAELRPGPERPRSSCRGSCARSSRACRRILRRSSCALALSAAAPRLFGRDGLADLDGKTFRIAVRDAGASVAFRIRRSRIEPLGGAAAADVTFTACAADYLLLATRRTDPDTLFFERRLLIEGDTETGLRLKNLLDAVELPRWLSGQ